MCKLSIIVPVYNTCTHLNKCIDSILQQIDDDMEIIAINDGSTDSSGELLKDLKKQNPDKIHYFEKTNGGIADARNYGIENANGKYILFVDSDDYIKENLIQELNNYIKQDIDIVKFKLEKVNFKGEVIDKIEGPNFEILTGREAFNTLAFSDVLIDSPCIYMFKKQLFEQYNLKFKTKTEHEDFGLIPLILLKAKSVASINVYGYCYVQSENSITRNKDYARTLKKFDDVLLHYDSMLKFVENEKLDKKTQKNVNYGNLFLH